MKKINSFAAYRYFIVPTEQVSIFEILDEKRKYTVVEFFNNLELQKKLIYEIDRRKHYIVYNHRIAENVYICKFCRELNETIYREGDTDIENVTELNLPFVYLIIDIAKQIILVEVKTSVFPSLNTIKNKLQTFFNLSFFQHGFDVFIEEITDEGNFWNYIDSSQGVYEVSLKLNSPNLFGGKIDTNEMLREINNEYNNTQVTFKLYNEKGKLSLLKNNNALRNALKYISGGAGEWSLTVIFNGLKKKYKSKNNIKKVSITDIESKDDNLTKEIMKTINTVETVLTNDGKVDENDKKS